MNLRKKKELAAKTLKVGKKRIAFNIHRIDEIKEAITKQDMKDLKESGAIMIKEITGTKKNVKRNTRRRAGSVKKRVKTKKKDYMVLVRKLRSHISELRKHGTLTPERYRELRKEIKAKTYKNKAQLKEKIAQE